MNMDTERLYFHLIFLFSFPKFPKLCQISLPFFHFLSDTRQGRLEEERVVVQRQNSPSDKLLKIQPTRVLTPEVQGIETSSFQQLKETQLTRLYAIT
jgi:hypothetical protein